MKWLLLNLICSTAFGQWTATTWNGVQWSEFDCDGSFAMQPRPDYAVFFTVPVDETLVNKTLAADISVDGQAGFTTRGEGVWNLCPPPIRARFYFTSWEGTYNPPTAGTHEDQFWWSREWIIELENGAWTTNVTAIPLSPDQWSNANGHIGLDRLNGFWSCARKAQRAGIAWGGHCFYDTGLAMTNGEAIFSIVSFSINPKAMTSEWP